MKRAFGAGVLLLLIGSAKIAAAQEVPVVAVFEIEDSTKRGKSVVGALTDYFRVKLAETRRFKVVDKSEQEAQLKKLIQAEKKNSYKTCVDESCQIPLGKELAADKIMRGKINRFGKAFVLSAELVDLATGASAGAASDKSDGSEEGLMASVERITVQLVGNTPAPPPPPPAVDLTVPPPPPPPPAVSSTTKPPPKEAEMTGGQLALIIGGWSVFAAGYMGEILLTLIESPNYIYYAFFPFIGPILVETTQSSLTEVDEFGNLVEREPQPLHYLMAGVQVLGAGVAVIGHVLVATAEPEAQALNQAPGTVEDVQVFFGPGSIGVRGRF